MRRKYFVFFLFTKVLVRLKKVAHGKKEKKGWCVVPCATLDFFLRIFGDYKKGSLFRNHHSIHSFIQNTSRRLLFHHELFF